MKNILLALLAFTISTHAATVKLAWDPSPDLPGYAALAGYNLYHSTNGFFTNAPVVVWPDKTTGEITGLEFEREYQFMVKAFNPFGESLPSNILTYTPPDIVNGYFTLFPTNLTKTNVVMVGRVNPEQGAFGAWFEWSHGTNFADATVTNKTPVQMYSGPDVTVTNTFAIIPTNYVYRMIMTNMVRQVRTRPIFFSTQPPRPIELRFQIHIIETSSLGLPREVWRDVEAATFTMSYPTQGTAFYSTRMNHEVLYDHYIPVPSPLLPPDLLPSEPYGIPRIED